MKKPYRSGYNTFMVKLEEILGGCLDFLKFKETESGVVYSDSSGYDIPLSTITIESNEGTFNIKAVRRNKLANILCIILAETENFYIVKDEN